MAVVRNAYNILARKPLLNLVSLGKLRNTIICGPLNVSYPMPSVDNYLSTSWIKLLASSNYKN
jgi:hypothetical protein